jgi:UDP-N-acetylmuramate dehydrogenase
MARRLAKQGYGGLEWAANVPGTVGGAVVNNAGAFGGDTASCVDSVTLADADGNSMKVSAAQLQYGYRTSVLKRHGLAYSGAPKPRESRDMGRLEPREGGDSGALALRELGSVGVVEATLKVLPSTPEEADGRVKEFNAQRMRSQPRILSAGSVFANPDGGFAGKLIEDAGLKGTWLGGAQISEQHANFIVNPGAATADDVYALVCRAQRMVFERLGIWLCPEIELFGRWSPEQRLVVRG